MSERRTQAVVQVRVLRVVLEDLPVRRSRPRRAWPSLRSTARHPFVQSTSAEVFGCGLLGASSSRPPREDAAATTRRRTADVSQRPPERSRELLVRLRDLFARRRNELPASVRAEERLDDDRVVPDARESA